MHTFCAISVEEIFGKMNGVVFVSRGAYAQVGFCLFCLCVSCYFCYVLYVYVPYVSLCVLIYRQFKLHEKINTLLYLFLLFSLIP